MKIKYNSQNMGKENIFTMANGTKNPYELYAINNNQSISKKKECDKCEYCAPNIEENKFVAGFQEKDFGICFKDYPTRVSVINPCIRREELICRKIGK